MVNIVYKTGCLAIMLWCIVQFWECRDNRGIRRVLSALVQASIFLSSLSTFAVVRATDRVGAWIVCSFAAYGLFSLTILYLERKRKSEEGQLGGEYEPDGM